MYIMNDYELIDLIQCEQDEIALDFMFKKYHRFIWKQVHLLNVEPKEEDDMHQEGVLTLLKAIQTFNPERNKSFTRYFELILKRQLWRLKRRLPDYYLYEHTDFCKGATYIEEDSPQVDIISDLECIVHEIYFVHRRSVAYIHETTGYSKKQIYNTIFRIKEKYKIVI